MKNSILNLGKVLNKAELKAINGSVKYLSLCKNSFPGNTGQTCETASDCTNSAPASQVCFRGCCNYYV